MIQARQRILDRLASALLSNSADVSRRPTPAEIQPYASSNVRALATRSKTVSSTVVRGNCQGGCHCGRNPRHRWMTTPRIFR